MPVFPLIPKIEIFWPSTGLPFVVLTSRMVIAWAKQVVPRNGNKNNAKCRIQRQLLKCTGGFSQSGRLRIVAMETQFRGAASVNLFCMWSQIILRSNRNSDWWPTSFCIGQVESAPQLARETYGEDPGRTVGNSEVILIPDKSANWTNARRWPQPALWEVTVDGSRMTVAYLTASRQRNVRTRTMPM